MVVAALLLVAGLVVFWTGRGTASFGWFAYAPLSEEVFSSSVVMWSRRQALGAALVVLGLLIGAGAGGYGLGRRHSGPCS